MAGRGDIDLSMNLISQLGTEKHMSNHIYRSNQEPERDGLSWEETWRGPDKGLVKCWEVGREESKRDPKLAARARDGELPVLCWKGGLGGEEKIKMKGKYGTLNYLAAWQGLRGEDLDIELSEEREIVCTRTNARVIFTADVSKWTKP
jgi:hypothetical protein